MSRTKWAIVVIAGLGVLHWVYWGFSGKPGGPATRVAEITRARALAADSEPGNWLLHGRTWDEQRHSPLTLINDGNAGQLGLAWYLDLPTRRGLEATPLVVDGIMYTTSAWSLVFAIDAGTGEKLWTWDPEVPRSWGRYACCDVVNRGVAAWNGRIYVGTLDGRLAALDAATGRLLWQIKTIPDDRPYTITGAPRVFNGKVVIGNGGAEYGVRGYVTAYDAETGEQAWRFYTVPGDPALPFESEAIKMAAKTWSGDQWWVLGGGGTAWDSFTFDPDLNLLYVGVGNGSPWNRKIRSPGGGDNLFLSSIVALDADSGEMVWHYQTTPGDHWDYTATQHMILAELEIGGRARKVIMQAPKNGFFYVLDRATGELLSAQAYVPVTWASGVDMSTGRPVENPEAVYGEAVKLIYPSPLGGHNWQPMSYSPATGLVYIPALDQPFPFSADPDFQFTNWDWNPGINLLNLMPPDDPSHMPPIEEIFKGHLAAWDPVAQKERWRVQHPVGWNGGVLSTAGNLLVQGTGDGRLVVYTADSGKKLWQGAAQTGIVAPPVTYTANGEQYIAVMAGWGGAFALVMGEPARAAGVRNVSRVLAFKLGGAATLPPLAPDNRVPEPPAATADAAAVDRGKKLYHGTCANCHGSGAVGGGVIADLRYMDAGTHDAFAEILLEGAYEGRGMPSYADRLNAGEAAAIHAYLIARAHEELARLNTE